MTELVTFRLANYETPLWTVENYASGRYNTAFSGYAQYLSLHPLAPWAELLRNEDRRTPERARMMRYPLWAIRVSFAAEPLVLRFDNAARFGLDPADLVADDHRPCRELAERFRRDGPHVFIAPSAALPGTDNLVILEPRVLTFWSVEPLDEHDLPGSIAAIDGRCPDRLWELVHYRRSRTPHAALDAWLRDEEFMLREPSVRAEASQRDIWKK